VHTAYDVARFRVHFPALTDGAAHFDGPGGSQTPDVVGLAMSQTLS
jgi:selenocysteine lyase/cysteine desulfurase